MNLSNKKFKTIWVLLISAYAIFMVYGSAIPNILLGALSSFFVYGIITKNIIISANKLKWIFVFSAFYFIYIVSLLYSENMDFGLKKIELQSILFVTPLIIISSRELLNKKDILRIIQYNIIASVFFVCISFVLAAKNYFTMESVGSSFFMERNLSTAFVDLHFLELALLISFNIVSLVYLRLNEKDYVFKYLKRYFMVILLLLILFLGLLNSRTALLAAVLTAFIVIFSHDRRAKNYKITLIAFTAITMLFMGNYTLNKAFKGKINEALNIDVTYSESKNWGGRGIRTLIWKCATNVLEDNLWLGVGVGDQQDELTLCYKKYRYGPLLYKERNFNAHNIFFQSLLKAGLLGFLFYFISLIYPVYFSFKKKNNFYIAFIFIFILNGTTESLLQVNFGVTFFSFFNAILFNLNYNNESITST